MLEREQIHFDRNRPFDLRPRITEKELKTVPVTHDDISCHLLDVTHIGVEHFRNFGEDLLANRISPSNSAFNDYTFVGVPNDLCAVFDFFYTGVLLGRRIEPPPQPTHLFSIVFPPIESLPSPLIPIE